MLNLRITRHPIHPALVHFPIVAWITALVGDGIYLLNDSLIGWQISYWAIMIGVATGLLAMAAGFMELVTIPANHPAWYAANQHMALMSTSWIVFTINLLLRDIQPPAAPLAIWLLAATSLLGCALLVLGGYFGANLVYDHGVGGHKIMNNTCVGGDM